MATISMGDADIQGWSDILEEVGSRMEEKGFDDWADEVFGVVVELRLVLAAHSQNGDALK